MTGNIGVGNEAGKPLPLHGESDIVVQRPTTNDQRPTTNDQRPTTNDQRPTFRLLPYERDVFKFLKAKYIVPNSDDVTVRD
ncbi:hypothetical protein BH09CHL1_BH09CHL1_20380 [soil metagenome]